MLRWNSLISMKILPGMRVQGATVRRTLKRRDGWYVEFEQASKTFKKKAYIVKTEGRVYIKSLLTDFSKIYFN